MCIRDRYQRRVRGFPWLSDIAMASLGTSVARIAQVGARNANAQAHLASAHAAEASYLLGLDLQTSSIFHNRPETPAAPLPQYYQLRHFPLIAPLGASSSPFQSSIFKSMFSQSGFKVSAALPVTNPNGNVVAVDRFSQQAFLKFLKLSHAV
eukprot:TRINITY_DN700_c0_g1_i1.p1 TRINITY_DN700_c0_g1~~TRINITY_DN700_c0_g1_i1.p1  ORF type:complete len:152 (-),score=53.21 TRINITY_DN700_c0_g1_i1:141-596(-)